MTGFLRQIAAAPHRALFLPGALQTVATTLWWLLELAPRVGAPMFAAPSLPAAAAHGWLMLYGLLPFFVFGFLFTALPNWLETGAIPQPRYLATSAALALGTALYYPGMYLAGFALAGAVIHLTGWGIGLAALTAALRASRHRDRHHAGLALAALALGGLGAGAHVLWLALEHPTLLVLAEQLGLWGGLTPLFLVVCHRMIPWFTSRVVSQYVLIRQDGVLDVLFAACLVHGTLVALDRPEWTWPADLVLAGLAAWLTTRWGIARTFGIRLLAMLHIGFLWAATAFLLHAFDSLANLLGLGAGFGLAPLHALTMGFFGAMLIGMATRVSLGHSGRKLEADPFTWVLFWLVQLATLIRLLPDLTAAHHGLIVLAAAIWLATFTAWTWRYAPFYWRARLDGKPG